MHCFHLNREIVLVSPRLINSTWSTLAIDNESCVSCEGKAFLVAFFSYIVHGKKTGYFSLLFSLTIRLSPFRPSLFISCVYS